MHISDTQGTLQAKKWNVGLYSDRRHGLQMIQQLQLQLHFTSTGILIDRFLDLPVQGIQSQIMVSDMTACAEYTSGPGVECLALH